MIIWGNLYTYLILLICGDVPNWDTTGSICYWFIDTPRLVGLMKRGDSMVSSGLQALSLTSLTNSTVRPLCHWVMKHHINRLRTINRSLLHMSLVSYKHVFGGKFSLVGGGSQMGNLSAHPSRLYGLLTVMLTMLAGLEVEGTLPRQRHRLLLGYWAYVPEWWLLAFVLDWVLLLISLLTVYLLSHKVF